MTRIAYDSIAKEEFKVFVFDYQTDNISDNDKLYRAFESGWPVVIKNMNIPGVDYEYYDSLPDWTIKDNKWIMPWYNSHIKKRERFNSWYSPQGGVIKPYIPTTFY